jgi:hypothetical protein
MYNPNAMSRDSVRACLDGASIRTVLTWANVAIFILASGCWACKAVVVGRVSSTENIATLSERDCGAMGRGSTLLSVRHLNVPDNDTHGVVVFAVSGVRKMEFNWRDARTLAVKCDACAEGEINFKAVKSGDVEIVYELGSGQR